MAGLVALESARLEGWKGWKLFAGAALLTWAATLQYFAIPAASGVVVYGIAAWQDLGWRRARVPAMCIAGGALLPAIPTLAFWAIPYFHQILGQIHAQGRDPGSASPIQEHLQLYRYFVRFGLRPFWVRLPLAAGIPVVLISTPILLAMRSTRILALAALPVQVALLLIAWHKHGYYFLNEFALYAAAISAGLLVIVMPWIGRLPGGSAVRGAAGIGLAALLIGALWSQTSWQGGLRVSIKPRTHEADLARAAGREMLGANVLVASGTPLWYAAGAAD